MRQTTEDRANDSERGAQYWIVDPSLEAALDDLTLLAVHLLQAPAAVLCSADDDHHVQFPATRGIDVATVAAASALCREALASRELFVVSDMALDPRFAQSSLVTSGPRFRFCACAPLRDGDGRTFGALLVFDRTPRTLERGQVEALRALADEAMRQLHVRHELGGLEHSLAEAQKEDAALRATNAALHALIRASPMAIIVLAQSRAVRMWSARAETMFGGSGATLHAWFADPSGAEAPIIDAIAASAASTRPQELRYRSRSGATFDVKVSAAPLRDEWGNITAYVGVVDDITQRKRAERRAAAELAATQVLAEERSVAEAAPRILQAICENLRWQWGTFWCVDAEAGVLRCVAQWSEPALDTSHLAEQTRLLSFSRGIGLPGAVWTNGAPRFVADIASDATLLRREAAVALGMRSALGVPVVQRGEVLGVFELLSIEARQPDEELLAMFTNIGGQLGQFMERKRIEEERDLFFAVSLEMLCILGVDGYLRRVNPAWQRSLGYTSQELVSSPFLDLVHEADRERTRSEMARLQSGVDTTFFEHRVRAKDGSYRWLSWACPGAQPGQPVLFAAVRDVTEVKEAEDALRQSEEQLRQAQKMEATGRLAGWTAHYFNNLLTAILGYSRLMLDRLGENDPLRDYAKQIQNAGERTASLTQQLLAFSRRQVMRPCIVDLNAVVADMDRMLRPLIGEDVELVTLLAPDTAPVRADRGQMEQVILNLVLNARDAMAQGGRVTIETRTMSADAAGSSVSGQPEGFFTVLVVTDNGVGMDAELKSKVFEPFFTTKRLGQGTGLGLSMVYGIVQQSGGHIHLQSALHAGTRVEVFLPAVQESERSALLASPAAATILVLEDEDTVRELTSEILRGAGYGVLAAKSGEEARRLSREREGYIHLLVTDVVLAGTSGPEVARTIVTERPETKVLYMSGYAIESVVRYGVIADEAFLAKPFTPEALERKVRQMLAPSLTSS